LQRQCSQIQQIILVLVLVAVVEEEEEKCGKREYKTKQEDKHKPPAGTSEERVSI
jgi:hypothetical protein